jgi:NitT/TauT family transport system substrate-binding protein
MNSNQATLQSRPTSLTLQLTWLRNVEFAGYFVAQQLGYYAEYGVDLSFRVGGTTLDPRLVVSEGSAHIGTVAETKDVIRGISQGLDNVVIGATYSQDCSCVMVRADSGIESIEDLRGHRLGLHPIEVDPMMRLFAARGIPEGSIEIVDVGFGVEEVFDGTIDGRLAGYWNEPVQLEMRGVPTRVFFYDPGYGDLLVASRESVDKKADTLAAFIKGSQRGWEFTSEHPEEVLGMVMAGFVENGEDEEQQRRQLALQLPWLQRTEAHGFLGMDTQILVNAIEFCQETGLLERPVAVADVMTLDILERALRLPKTGTSE